MINFVKEFDKLLNKVGWGAQPALDFLYENRNAMSKKEFDECIIAYGNFNYEEVLIKNY